MSGIVTSTRNLSAALLPIAQWVNGTRFWQTDVRLLNDQSTTSFRSSSRVDPSWDEQKAEFLQVTAPARIALADSFDTGHEFSTYKRQFRTSHKGMYTGIDSSGRTITTEGPLILNFGQSGSPMFAGCPSIQPLSPSEISKFGGLAISKTSPTAASASLATLLGELKGEGLPSLIGASVLRSRAHFFQKMGGEYLNVEFGWKPLLSDLNKLLVAVQKSSQIIDQYRRDSGRLVRRRYSFEPTVTTEVTTFVGSGVLSPTYYVDGNWKNNSASRPFTITDTISTRIWFSGAYMYYLDLGDSLVSKAHEFEQLANKLLGTRVTPSTLWELAPWSWLADWNANIGTNIANASMLQNDGLVLKYGYLMRHTVHVRTVSCDLVDSNGKFLRTVTNTFRIARKERVKASPYGFSLSMDDYSPRQWAILAALGLTKAPRTVRYN